MKVCHVRPLPKFSHNAMLQLRAKRGIEFIRLLRRLPGWEEVKNWHGHLRFLNRDLPFGRNTIEIHYHHGRTRLTERFLRQVLARLALDEEQLKELHFIK